MASKWRQLLPQFVAMMLLYFVGVFALVLVGIEGFVPRIIVALVVAIGYPRLLRQLDMAPEAWQR